ncbi:short-chain dehydrogenase TIC 32, chloroplastic [Aspergillus udagawae]|uniref:Short-chain dehydrogenase TIC 32, chloroplastic n=1 Tax=Aspergillus udagawae TaxID=91492 RepID=A0A8H3NJB5_9EURO|nr:short-chain dehydrogenase TIC 32, chloroplastic [Aspergillus udagawae]
MATHINFDKNTTGDEVVQAFASQVKGRTFAITGTSAGSLGAETALSLARNAQPAQIILLSPHETRVRPVISEIQTINSSIKTWFVPIDLGNSASIHAAVDQIFSNPEIKRIDVLINNAGIMACPYTPVSDWKDPKGAPVELQFGANHLGHFLLTMLLIDQIRRPGSAARVVNVSAASHRFSEVHFDDLNFSDGATYHPWKAYAQSKTAMILSMRSLASKIPSADVTFLSLHPGIIATSLARHMDSPRPDPAVIEAHLKFPNAEHLEPKTLQQGCATTMVAALDPALQAYSGSYLNDCQLYPAADFAVDETAAERLWSLSKGIVGI